MLTIENKSYSQMAPFDFWNSIGNPKYVCAPMVDQSELPFRMLCRKYNTDLCFTPMIHSVYVIIYINNNNINNNNIN